MILEIVGNISLVSDFVSPYSTLSAFVNSLLADKFTKVNPLVEYINQISFTIDLL